MADLVDHEEFCEDLRQVLNRHSIDARLGVRDFLIAAVLAGLLDDPAIQQQLANVQFGFDERMKEVARDDE